MLTNLFSFLYNELLTVIHFSFQPEVTNRQASKTSIESLLAKLKLLRDI